MKIKILTVLALLYLCTVPSIAKCDQYYRPEINVGKYQPIGTLAPISHIPKPHSSKASKAIILIPGLNGVKLTDELFEWRALWNYWTSEVDQNIQEDYMLFVFRYDGWNSLLKSANKLSSAINDVLVTHPNIEEIVFVGYSQGGIIARIIQGHNPNIETLTSKTITLATGHHGAVAFSDKLMSDILKSSRGIVGLRDKLVLKLLRKWYHNGLREQSWDNFDNAVPKSANYTVPSDTSHILSLPVNQSKFIAYGSYFYPPTPKNWEDRLKFIAQESIPRLFFRSSAGQVEMSRSKWRPIYRDETKAFRYSVGTTDGVVQLSSTLWLRNCPKDEKSPDHLQAIFPFGNFCGSDGVKHRVFKNMSHLDWRKPPTRKLKDLAHKKQPSKALYQWIIDDILD